MLSVVNELIKKFRINVNQIIANSDNTMEDIINESFIVVSDNYEQIKDNDRVFINELKTRCLRFNKYGRRIESKERWEKYNELEQRMVENFRNILNIDEDILCLIVDIKNIIGENNYIFLLDYFTYTGKVVSKKYGISEPTMRKRVSELIEKLRRSYGRC